MDGLGENKRRKNRKRKISFKITVYYSSLESCNAPNKGLRALTSLVAKQAIQGYIFPCFSKLCDLEPPFMTRILMPGRLIPRDYLEKYPLPNITS